jgi:hypothetical protein
MTNAEGKIQRRNRHRSLENSSLPDSPLSVAALGFMMIAAVDFRPFAGIICRFHRPLS